MRNHSVYNKKICLILHERQVVYPLLFSMVECNQALLSHNFFLYTQWTQRTVTPFLKQTGRAAKTRNMLCMIFKRGCFDDNQHIVSKLLRLALTIISPLEQHNILLSLHLEVMVTAFLSTECILFPHTNQYFFHKILTFVKYCCFPIYFVAPIVDLNIKYYVVCANLMSCLWFVQPQSMCLNCHD